MARTTEVLLDKEIYERVVPEILSARRELIIETALIKQTVVKTAEGMVSICSVLSGLHRRGVDVRILFAGRPSKAFMEGLREHPELLDGCMALCFREHKKSVFVDCELSPSGLRVTGGTAVMGSANMTGSGWGVKRVNARNFEWSVYSTDPNVFGRVYLHAKSILSGAYCEACGRQGQCQIALRSFLDGLA